MARLLAILNTTAARLSALYLLLFAVCATFLVIYMTSLSANMLVSQTRDAINEEVRGLDRAYQRGGLPVLVRVMEARARQPGANLYMLADINGRILSGNVESLQPGILDITGWTERPFTYTRYGESEQRLNGRVEEKHEAMAVVFRLPSQFIVLVGRDLGEPEKFRRVMQRALVVTLAIMSLGAFLIWYFVGRRALKRIDRVSAASRRIMAGDLTGRLPISSAGDEFDRLSDNLNKMLDRIAALNEGLRQVSDNIAHDLKTPLTRLRNRAEAALAGKPKTDDYREALERTIAESDQLIRTFNAILMISRLEAGYSAELTTAVDLRAIVDDVEELYEPLAEEEGVTLTASKPEGAVEFQGNRELVGQALSNIVDNAIKYSSGSGDAPRVELVLERSGDEIRLTVRDNGPGVPEADRDRVTERFVRLEESRTQPGSGLGLSLAKAVMTFHGGRLEFADNNPGLAVAMVFPASPASRKS
ncbi:sensor histidine kinase [Nitratireductor indicus]|uniref:histidine kinase n=1 Tax=Nitratireductor indicus C115 TaxID=1231190 RepID=K2PHQ8_9HYPH|nr:HAMP domain-containing sensor histidine kinase [Nitratireductor indicus]EKF40657.1 integral membrane sensor signal transduction histidine kinase [Nitratireductor indicus C115]MDS1134635.1 HAMP domain-containing sensor histidine kinase [Nitratireductor indicus]SFQ43318.1 Signal transduction histidine kinase [Nitratireductor indicus]